MTIALPSRTPGSPVPSLAELARLISADESIPMRRRQEITSALRLLGRTMARPLEEIPADPRHLRERFAALTPAMAGVSAGRWSNAMSLVRAALKHAGLATIPGRSTEPLGPEWKDLFAYLNNRRMRESLSRFARYCTALGIAPTAVSDQTSSEFLLALENEGVIRNPRQVHRAMCVAWNRAASMIDAWPSTSVTVPQYRQIYSLPWNAFLPSLRSDILAYLDRLSGDDLLADVDFRPLRASSIATYDRLLRQFLSALVQRGHDPQTLQSLADVVPLETVKLGLRFFIDRAAGAKSKQAYHIARLLTAIARHWAKVETHHLDRGRRDCRSGSA